MLFLHVALPTTATCLQPLPCDTVRSTYLFFAWLCSMSKAESTSRPVTDQVVVTLLSSSGRYCSSRNFTVSEHHSVHCTMKRNSNLTNAVIFIGTSCEFCFKFALNANLSETCNHFQVSFVIINFHVLIQEMTEKGACENSIKHTSR
jgi:hypothetical protein